MKNPVIRFGKVGNVVWGRNRHGRTCYQLVIPTNPRTVGQQANRGTFGSVVSEWGRLREEYREEWNETGRGISPGAGWARAVRSAGLTTSRK